MASLGRACWGVYLAVKKARAGAVQTKVAGKTAATGEGKRSRAVQQRALDTRKKILDAAIQEFAAWGYEGASTRTIAEKAGVQHTLVSYHFKAKEELWRETVSSLLADYSTAFDARLKGLEGADDVTKLRLLNEHFIRFGAKNLHFHMIMAHIASAPSAQLDWLIDEHLRHIFDSRAALIRRVQKAGYYVQGDPYHLQYAFIGAVTRIFMLSAEAKVIIGRSPLTPKFVEEHIQLCHALFFRKI